MLLGRFIWLTGTRHTLQATIRIAVIDESIKAHGHVPQTLHFSDVLVNWAKYLTTTKCPREPNFRCDHRLVLRELIRSSFWQIDIIGYCYDLTGLRSAGSGEKPATPRRGETTTFNLAAGQSTEYEQVLRKLVGMNYMSIWAGAGH